MITSTDATQNELALDEKPPIVEYAMPTAHALSKRESYQSSADSFKSTFSQLQESDTPASSTETSQAKGWQPPTDGPLKTPIPEPMLSCKSIPPPKLTEEQEKKYATVLAGVSQWESIPNSMAKNVPKAPIQDFERMWLTRECLLRYLRATKWNTAQALKRLQSTLSWRRGYGADTFTAEYISPENETAKQLQLGFDNDARPCLYLNPAKQNTKMSDRQIHHLCYMIDRTIDMMPPGTENLALLINFKGAASGNVPTVGQARAVLNILQGHNPERLGKALISELPWYVTTFFKLISSFIDPVTKEKMKFNQNLRNFVPPQQLWDQHEGDLDFEYDHSIYWPAFTGECARRRAAMTERWEKAGMQIGEYEEYLRGGNHPSLQDMISSTTNGDLDASTAAIDKLRVQ